MLSREWSGWDMAALQARLVPVALGGQTVYSLSPRDLLHCLALHGHLHQWSRLKWLIDLALFERLSYASLWAQVAIWLRVWFRPRPWDRVLIRLPRSLAVLYYPLRLGHLLVTRPRLVLRGLSRFVRMLWADGRVRLARWLKLCA